MQPAQASVRILRPHGEVAERLADLSGHAEILDHLVTDWAPATWPLTRTHLERAYAQAMLRLKAMLEGQPPRGG